MGGGAYGQGSYSGRCVGLMILDVGSDDKMGAGSAGSDRKGVRFSKTSVYGSSAYTEDIRMSVTTQLQQFFIFGNPIPNPNPKTNFTSTSMEYKMIVMDAKNISTSMDCWIICHISNASSN